jgi:hypothetical protein
MSAALSCSLPETLDISLQAARAIALLKFTEIARHPECAPGVVKPAGLPAAVVSLSKYDFSPPKADKGLFPRRWGRYMAFIDTPVLCGGVVHYPGGIDWGLKLHVRAILAR